MRVANIMLFALAATPALLAQTSWTPYVAQYVQITTVTEPGGETNTTQILGEEKRSSDGSLLRTQIENGVPVRGHLWDAKTGRITQFNYLDKRGYLERVAPRKHTSGANANDALGTQEIAGVLCTGYRSRVGNDARNSGAVWVDSRDDIMMKNEIHDFLNGEEIVQTRAITSISFAEPAPKSMKIPADIEIQQVPGRP